MNLVSLLLHAGIQHVAPQIAIDTKSFFCLVCKALKTRSRKSRLMASGYQKNQLIVAIATSPSGQPRPLSRLRRLQSYRLLLDQKRPSPFSGPLSAKAEQPPSQNRADQTDQPERPRELMSRVELLHELRALHYRDRHERRTASHHEHPPRPPSLLQL